MRIGIVVPGFSADADDWCIPALRNVVKQLAMTNEVRVIALRYPFRAGRYGIFGAQITALGGAQRGGWRSLGVWGSLLNTLALEHMRHRFDVLHAFWANETGALTAVAGRLLRVPTLVSLAGGELVGFRDISYGGQLARTERQKVNLALRLASGVTAGSRSMLEQARPWLRSLAAHRVPLGVDLSLFRPQSSSPSGQPIRLIHVASLTPVKGQAVLLQAAARLRERGLSFRLEIVGGGSLGPHLRALASRMSLGDVVDFRGEIRHDQLPQVHGRGTAFVLSSRHEAQGMAVLEAAACGLPVVGTPVGIVPELSPAAAIAVPVDDPNAMADAIVELVSHQERRFAMATEARRRVEEEYSVERCAERFREIYIQLSNPLSGK